MCGLDTVGCPYHLALGHLTWLTSTPVFAGDESPLFPTVDGSFPDKANVVSTFEAIATLIDLPLTVSTAAAALAATPQRETKHVQVRIFGPFGQRAPNVTQSNVI